jgi:hypothetical protein
MAIQRRILLGRAAARAVPGRAARAQGTHPDRPVRMVVGFPAGGATDTWARLVARPLREVLGQPVVVENRSGAGGMIAGEFVAEAPPDGCTQFFTITSLVQSPVVFRRWLHDPIADFGPDRRPRRQSAGLRGRPDGAGGDVGGVRASRPRARLQPRLPYGQVHRARLRTPLPGRRAARHGQCRRPRRGADADRHARRPCPMWHRQHHFDEGPHAGGPHPRLGRARGRHLASLPGVPTFLELGYPPEFDLAGFVRLVAPARTPPAVQARLIEAFRAMMRRQDLLSAWRSSMSFQAGRARTKSGRTSRRACASGPIWSVEPASPRSDGGRRGDAAAENPRCQGRSGNERGQGDV